MKIKQLLLIISLATFLVSCDNSSQSPVEPVSSAPVKREIHISSPGDKISCPGCSGAVQQPIDGRISGFSPKQIRTLEVHVSIFTDGEYPQSIVNVRENGTWSLTGHFGGTGSHTIKAVVKQKGGGKITSVTKYVFLDRTPVASTPEENTNTDVRITMPSSIPPGSNPSVIVMGTYSDVVKKDDIWLFVWPEGARYTGWPQSDDGCNGKSTRKRNGEWSVRTYFGGPPQNYDLAVYTATPSASSFIADKHKEWCKNKDWPGINDTDLPSGLTEKHRIQVRKP